VKIANVATPTLDLVEQSTQVFDEDDDKRRAAADDLGIDPDEDEDFFPDPPERH